MSEDDVEAIVGQQWRVQRFQQTLDRAYELSAELARLDGRLERLVMYASAAEVKEAARLIGNVIRELNARMEGA